jgi:hypothetical protein
MSTTALHAGMIVLDAYPLADNGCCSQNADASYTLQFSIILQEINTFIVLRRGNANRDMI